MNGHKSVDAYFQYYCDVLGCRKPPAPGNVSATLADGTFTVGWDEVPGVARYRVSFRSGSEGDWSELTDETATDTSATWTPTTRACGETYTFRVEALGDGRTYRDAWGEAATSPTVTAAACDEP